MSETESPVRCPCCGCAKFIEGDVKAFGELYFIKSHKKGLIPAGELIARATKCDKCGNIQFFVR